MTEPSIRQQGDHWIISGDLSFDTVPGLLERSRELLAKSCQCQVDLAGVGEMDSAGLGLLLEWLREARASGGDIHYRNIPEKIMSMARVCGLEQVLHQA